MSYTIRKLKINARRHDEFAEVAPSLKFDLEECIGVSKP